MDKRTIIAFVLIGLIILFYDDYIRWMYPPPPELEGMATDSTEVISEERDVQPVEHRDLALNTPGGDLVENTYVEDYTSFEDSTTILPERIVTVETDVFKARLTTDGAKIVSFALKPNGRYLKKDLQLVSLREETRPGFRFWTVNGEVETTDIRFGLYNDEDSSDVEYQVNGSQTRKVEFVKDYGSERKLIVSYEFSGDGHSFMYEVETEGMSNAWVRDYAEVYWTGGLASTEENTAHDEWYTKAYNYYVGNELEDLKTDAKKEKIVGPTAGETRWGAIRNKYFLMALIPETANAVGAWMANHIDSTLSKEDQPNLLEVGLRVPIANSNPITPIRVFVGPLDDDILNQIDPSLKNTMSWGWPIIAPFSKAILWSLKMLGKFIPNYGLCIIIFSIIIKIIIWPLTRKSYQSMAAMGKLQPQLKEIREKHKNNPQKAQTEIMKLYKEEKVNPMGGCWPTLLQMPLLYALFIVFRSTIEFRRAPFMFWITDLSQPDILFHIPFAVPLYGSHVALLPILMGISTFFQSKSTVTDPNQKMMIYFMPIFMTLIFNQFPSGLTLYYTLFNIWTMLQQKFTPPPKSARERNEAVTGA